MKVVVANSQEDVNSKLQSLYNEIHTLASNKADVIPDLSIRANVYASEFRDHPKYKEWRALYTRTQQVNAKGLGELPIHTSKWHLDANKKWEDTVKIINDLMDSHPKHDSTAFRSKKAMYETMLKHAHEEIAYHRKMAKLLKED